MSNFLGIKQVLFSEYSSKSQSEKIGYLWLVRNGEGSESFDIYFGSRKYGSNDLSVISKLHNAFGGLLDSEGSFKLPMGVDFKSFDDANVGDFSDILLGLDVAIKTNQDALAKVYTKTEVDGLIDGVEALLNNYATGVTVTVGKSTYTGTLANNVVNVDLSDAFDAAGKVKDVTVDGVSVMDGTTAKIDLTGKANVGASYTKAEADAKFLTGVTIPKYEIVKQETADAGYAATYYLSKDGAQVGVKINTTLDQVLKSSSILTVETANVPYEGAEVGDKYVKFEFQNNDTPQYLPVKDLVDVYTGSDSIEVSNNNVISVKNVNSEKVEVAEIPVGGTPLADVLLAKNVTAITSGNLQVVLESLFSQNLWAENPRRNVPTGLTVSMSAPTITFSVTGTTEVGTSLDVTASAKTASASANITYSGFTYGYSSANDNTKDGDTPASVSVTGTKDTNSNYKLSFVTNNGFGGVDIADVTGSTLAATAMVVADGTNKITVTASSPTFTATVPGQNKIYACSSLKKTDENHVVAASQDSTITGSVKTDTGATSVTGAYYAFVGFSDTLPTTSAGYRAFIGNGFSRLGKGSVAAGTCNKTYMAVCVPSGWDFSCNTSLGADMRSSFTETGDVTIILPNGDEKAYKYYALTYKDGAFKDLVIK